jgi:hypothetical protein
MALFLLLFLDRQHYCAKIPLAVTLPHNTIERFLTMQYNFLPNQPLPEEITNKGTRNSVYSDVYKKILSLPIVDENVNKWLEIGGIPNRQSVARLQACINPSITKQGKAGKNPRVYQSGLIEQGAKVVSRRLEHKDGTFSLFVKKVSRENI